MQANVTYLLTEQAQRAAMAATGQPVAREQTMAVEIAGEDLDIFANRIRKDGSIALDLTHDRLFQEPLTEAGGGWIWSSYEGILAPRLDPPFLEDLKRGLAGVAALHAEQKRKKEAEQAEIRANGEHNRRLTEEAYQKFLADPEARLNPWSSEIRQEVPDLRGNADYYPEKHKEWIEEIQRRNQVDKEVREAAEKAHEQAKSKFISEWIKALPDAEYAELKQQHHEGLLCKQKALDLIAEEGFQKAGSPVEFTGGWLESKDLKCVSTAAYATWRRIKSQLPEGYTVRFFKARDEQEDEETGEPTNGPWFTLATISIPYGPFRFERTVEL